MSWSLHNTGARVDERIELIQRAYRTFNQGEPDLSVLHPEFCLVQTESIVGTAGEFHGHEGVRRSRDELLEGFDPVRFEPEKYDELKDGRLLVRCRWTGRGTASGIEMDAPVWHLWSFHGGLLSRMEVYGSKREALAAAGVEPTPRRD